MIIKKLQVALDQDYDTIKLTADEVSLIVARETPKKIRKGTNDLGEDRYICPSCHCDVETNWHYCENCGQRLE